MKRDFENFFFLQGTPRLNEKLLELHKKRNVTLKQWLCMVLYDKVYYLNYI